MRNAFFLLALVASTSLACVATADREDEGSVDDAEGAVSLSSTSTYFKVRHDMRKCMSPMCGGYFVSQVNDAMTRCHDGKYAKECYVAQIDWSSAGLVESDAEGAASLLFRGSIGFLTFGSMGNYGVLKATEVWSSPILETETGSYYRVTDAGIRCFRAPCLNMKSDRLNSTSSRMVSEIGGYYGPKAASAVMGEGGAIVAGSYYSTKDGGRGVTATKFWKRVKHVVSDPLACTTSDDCTSTVYRSAPATKADCYCRTCPTSVMNTSTEAANQAAYELVCGDTSLTCPMVKCMAPPPVACVAGKCQFTP